MAMLVYADFTAKGLLRDTNEGITITKFIAFACEFLVISGFAIAIWCAIDVAACSSLPWKK